MTLQYRLAHMLISALARLIFGWKVIGRDNIPESGGLIAANHISALDPPLIGSAIKRELFYFAKIELFRNALFGAALKSVNAFPAHRGQADRQAWKTSQSLLKAGKLLLFFPEGTRSKDGRLQSAKPGLARLAFAANVPVIPAAISGSNRLKDVFLRRCKLRVGFARPLLLSDFGQAESDVNRFERLTDAVMLEIGRLKREVEAA